MKLICTFVWLMFLLAACATVEPEPQVESPRPVAGDSARANPTPEPPTPEDPEVEPMPFADSMSGPSRTGPEEYVPDPNKRITVYWELVDGKFVIGVGPERLHVVLLDLASRAGVMLTLEGTIPDTFGPIIDRGMDPEEAIRTLCKANNLDLVIDGEIWIIKKRVWVTRIFAGELEGCFDVNFDEEELVNAIMQVAGLTGVELCIPSEPSSGEVFQPTYVTLKLENATPDHILRELARLGDLDVEVQVGSEGQPTWLFRYRE